MKLAVKAYVAIQIEGFANVLELAECCAITYHIQSAIRKTIKEQRQTLNDYVDTFSSFLTADNDQTNPCRKIPLSIDRATPQFLFCQTGGKYPSNRVIEFRWTFHRSPGRQSNVASPRNAFHGPLPETFSGGSLHEPISTMTNEEALA